MHWPQDHLETTVPQNIIVRGSFINVAIMSYRE